MKRFFSAVICLPLLTTLSLQAPKTQDDKDPARLFPTDTLLFAGWPGGTPSTGAEPSLQRFLIEMSIRLEPAIRRKMEAQGQLAFCDALKPVSEQLFRNPGGLGIIQLGLVQGGPDVQIALVSKLGAQADAFLQNFETLLKVLQLPTGNPASPIKQIPIPVPMGVFYGVKDGVFVLAVGPQTVNRIFQATSGAVPSLAQSEKLIASRKKIGGDSNSLCISLFSNTQEIVQRAKSLLPMIIQDDEEKERVVEACFSFFNLDAQSSVTWEIHRRDKGYLSAAHYSLIQPPSTKGLPVSDEELARIPLYASSACRRDLDLGATFRSIQAFVNAAFPEPAAEIRQSLANFEKSSGLKIDKDILDLFGRRHWVFNSPENGGMWFTGNVFILECKDSKLLQQNLKKLIEWVKFDGPQFGELNGKKFMVSQANYRDHNLSVLRFPEAGLPLALSWTVHDNQLILGFFPQTVETTLDHLLDGKPATDSLLAHADIKNAKKILGGFGPRFSFAETKEPLRGIYPILLGIAQVSSSLLADESIDFTVAGMPSFRTLARGAFAEFSTDIEDESGCLSVAYRPFLVSLPPFLSDMSGAGTPLILSAILFPAIQSAKARSAATLDRQKLQLITLACTQYAGDKGQWPESLEKLVTVGYLQGSDLVLPRDHSGKSSFQYMPPKNAGVQSSEIVSFVRRDLWEAGGDVAVSFANGNVTIMKAWELEKLLSKPGK